MRWLGLCLGITVALVVFVLLTTTGTERQRRFVANASDHSAHPNPPHPYALNMWWRYANNTVKDRGHKGDCYVCTCMPTSAVAPTVEAFQPEKVWGNNIWLNRSAAALCALNIAGDLKGAPQEQYLKRYNNIQKCSVRDLIFAQPSKKLAEPILTAAYGSELKLHHCVKGNGTNLVGETTGCINIVSYCVWNNTARGVDTEPLPNTTCNTGAPTQNGTRAVDGWYWLCGHKIRVALPPHWGGICALVMLTDHTIIISAINTTMINHRVKRDITEKHDPLWGTNVPPDQKLWSTGDKVALALFPQLGVGKIMLRVETMNYRMTAIMNLTINATGSIRRELTALRLMTLQNRMALDMITASQGGVCVMIGTSCCTFIPENDADGGKIDQAMRQLKNLAALQQKELTSAGNDWWNWLMGGGWRSALMALAGALTGVICLLMLCSCCAVPLIRGMVSRLISVSPQYQALMLVEPDKYDMEKAQNTDSEDDDDTAIDLGPLFDEKKK